MAFRIEKDTMGEVQVPADKYWAAQTERSRNNFKIGPAASMPHEIIEAFGYLKKAAAFANCDLGVLPAEKRDLIATACDEILAGKLDDQFPLVIWQTGSGTQSNMNVNEVVANRAHVLHGGKLGEKSFIHPNDDVNKSQSSNDTFPTAMHIAAYKKVVEHTIPCVERLQKTFAKKSAEFKDVVKIGRTHLMDATPLTLGQEFSAYAAQLDFGLRALRNTLPHLSQLALGGTAVGTGLNTPKGYDVKVADYIAKFTGLPFVTAENKFEALAAHDAIVETHGAIKQLAMSLFKIANDIRLLASGPRSGIGEILIPENEPGSSIMPGKVNPVIPEVVNQICYRIIGNDLTVTFAAEAGQLQLNVMEPVMVHAIFSSIKMLQKGMDRLRILCVEGITANTQHCREMVLNSIGIVTALNPTLGYENSSRIAKRALKENRSVYDLVLEEGLLTKDELDQLLKPESMIKPHKFYKKK